MIMIGVPPPDSSKIYPAELRSSDGTLEEFNEEFASLRLRISSLTVADQCRATWDLLRRLYVADPSMAGALHWAPCHIANETRFMFHFMKYIVPSLAVNRLSEEALSSISMPILIVHGTKDRSAPYGGALDWARQLPNARLLTIENAAHVPWIEAPRVVYGAIRTFLGGGWPSGTKSLRQR